MSDWPYPARPGIPLNPEQDGWHWLCHNEIDQEEAALWDAKGNFWQLTGTDDTFSPRDLVVRKWGYAGPCLTPDEATALQARHEEAERTALQAAECHARETRRADALQKRVAELEGALAAAARLLHKAGEQFTFYAKQHAAKGTADGDQKAATNQQWAERCFSAYWAANDTAEGGKDE